MKVNLYGDLRNGYLNIVNQVPEILGELPDDTHAVMGLADQLDPVLKDNEADEIIFGPPLNVLLPSNIIPVLQHWLAKLKPEGSLALSYVDIRRLGKFIHSGELTLQELDTMIYGPNHQYHSLIDTNVLSAVLKGIGYSIKMIAAKDYFVTIEAVKNAD